MNEKSFEILNSTNAKEKYQFVNKLIDFGKHSPETLYPYISTVISLLDSKNSIIKWTGIDLLGYLISVDTDHKIVEQLPRLYMNLNTGKMITANHVVWALIEIANVLKERQKEIIETILKVQEYNYDTEECKNIVYGNIIKGFSKIYNTIDDDKIKSTVYEFIKNQVGNRRNSTKKKAETFIKKHKNSKS